MLILVRLINHPHITGLIGTGDRLLGVARDVKYTARCSLGKRVHFAVWGEKLRRVFPISQTRIVRDGARERFKVIIYI